MTEARRGFGGNAFYKHVKKEWRHEQTRKGARELASTMSPQWLPSADALEILGMLGSATQLHRGRHPGACSLLRKAALFMAPGIQNLLNIFAGRAKYTASFGLDDTPRPIAMGGSQEDCFEILQLAEIDEAYARGRCPSSCCTGAVNR